MIGAGGQAGQDDAANLLKPALARGELRTIAATTWSEYKKYFEKDAALARRFQVVKVEEPDRDAVHASCCAAWSARSRSITTCASSTKRSPTPCGCPTATSVRPPAARQGGQRARHRLRPRRARPDRDAARDRGRAAARSRRSTARRSQCSNREPAAGARITANDSAALSRARKAQDPGRARPDWRSAGTTERDAGGQDREDSRAAGNRTPGG